MAAVWTGPVVVGKLPPADSTALAASDIVNGSIAAGTAVGNKVLIGTAETAVLTFDLAQPCATVCADPGRFVHNFSTTSTGIKRHK